MTEASELWAFLAEDSTRPPLDEGLTGIVGVGQLVTISPRTRDAMRVMAETIAIESGRRVRMVRFTRAEVVEVFEPGPRIPEDRG